MSRPADPTATPSKAPSNLPKVAIDPVVKAKKIAALEKRNVELEAEIAATKARLEDVSKDLKHPPSQTVRSHIAALHDYNEIRDIGQQLIGLVADTRNVRLREVYEDFGVAEGD